jgi:amino acid transporter
MTAVEDEAGSAFPSSSRVREASPLHGLARRTLGFYEVWAQSVAAAAPSAAAASVPVMVFVAAGQASLWSVGLAIVLSLLIASTIGQFARRMAGAGSLYTFVARSLGGHGAAFAGTMLCAGYSFVAMFTLGQSGVYLSETLGVFDPALAMPPIAVAIVVALMGSVCYLILSRGIRISTRMSLLIEALSIAVVVLLSLVVLTHVPIQRWSVVVVPHTGIGGIAAGSVAAMTAFVGFESSVSLGAETRHRFAVIPRAVKRTVPLVGCVLLLSSFVQVVGFGSAGINPDDGASPINALASAFHAPAIGLVLDVTTAASFLACAIASTTALVRVLLSMSREGLLPASLGRTHPRFHTPHRAIAFVMPAIAGVPIVFACFGRQSWQGMNPLMVCSVVGYMLAYLIVAVSAPIFLHRLGETTARSLVIAGVTAILVALSVICYVFTQLGADGGLGVALLIVLAIAGLSWYRHRLRRDPGLAGRLGMYDETIAADLLENVSADEDRSRSLRGAFRTDEDESR